MAEIRQNLKKIMKNCKKKYSKKFENFEKS